MWKNYKVRGNFSSYCGNDGVTFIQNSIFGFDFDQDEIELWRKVNLLCTATENCFQADRLEINIWVNAIICYIIFYLDCLNILLYLRTPYQRELHRKHLLRKRRNYEIISNFKFHAYANVTEHFSVTIDCVRFLIRRFPLYTFYMIKGLIVVNILQHLSK